jgi:hypothetical protein
VQAHIGRAQTARHVYRAAEACKAGDVAMIRTGTFAYVTYKQVELFHLMGWMVVSDLGPTHGQYAVLMWRCDCD